MLSELSFDTAALVVLDAFAFQPPPESEDDLAGWLRDQLARNTWSATEQAVLEIAAGLVRIEDYEARCYDPDGRAVVERRRVSPIGALLSASFDGRRAAHVLAGLELAVVGARPLDWHWLSRLPD